MECDATIYIFLLSSFSCTCRNGIELMSHLENGYRAIHVKFCYFIFLLR